MTKRDIYHIHEILSLLEQNKNIEVYDLLEKEAKHMLLDLQKSRLSQKNFCSLISTLYQKFSFTEKYRYVPVWVRDFLNESIDICVSEKTLNLQILEGIVNNKQI